MPRNRTFSLPFLIMQKVNESSQWNEACWLFQGTSCWAALVWEVMSITEPGGLVGINPQSQLLLLSEQVIITPGCSF